MPYCEACGFHVEDTEEPCNSCGSDPTVDVGAFDDMEPDESAAEEGLIAIEDLSNRWWTLVALGPVVVGSYAGITRAIQPTSQVGGALSLVYLVCLCVYSAALAVDLLHIRESSCAWTPRWYVWVPLTVVNVAPLAGLGVFFITPLYLGLRYRYVGLPSPARRTSD